MIQLACDYQEGACEEILQLLRQTNFVQTPGYGEDDYCAEARNLIRAACHAPNAAVHFLVGGTQTNVTIIDAVLKSWQGVLCADSGHINVHETGAPEASGHKCLTIPAKDGKLTAAQLQTAYDNHWNDVTHEHMAQPGMVYLSNPTEMGTLYTKTELTDIHNVCKKCHLPLFLDGARMGYGLMAEENDLTLADYAQLCDVFYIGGTKQGALFGEAVVIPDAAWLPEFRYSIKQHGGMLAKGRLLGLQFIGLFQDGAYYRLAAHADHLAMKLRQAFMEKGWRLLVESRTNQQFVILPNDVREQLAQQCVFSDWYRVDEAHTAVRFCTSWATKTEDIERLIGIIKKL